MKHSFIWLILCIISSPCVSPILGQDCQPITGTENLARTSNTLNQTIGINVGTDIERFFGNIPGYSFNQDSILLSDVMLTSPILRFFYSQNKDYDNNSSPRAAEDLASLSFEDLVNVNDRSTHFSENYVRILPLFEAGFEVQVAIEISHGKVFPDKWWTLEELSSEAKNNSSPNINRVVVEIADEGKDWATAFLKIYDPKNSNGEFSTKPIVTVLELGNEPWGDDLGVEGYRAYIKGMYDAFVDYYNHPTQFRIKLASAAFQGHASVGSDFYNGNLLDYAGVMIGDEGNSIVDLGPLRNALTEGVGIHNYSFSDYCDIDANTLINHPERSNNGFLAYKNISEWVNYNMPPGTQKVNATEYGWNSDYEPKLYFPCAEGQINQYGGCNEVANYDEVVAISFDGRKYDYNEERLIDQKSQKIVGRTAQAAYIVRSTLIMNRWGVNKTMLYGLLDDWSNPLYFSNGLIDTDRAQSDNITLDELKDIEPNPSGKKESWYAVKRLKEVLGDKYFIEQYGSEEDGGTHTYTYGDIENGPPTHLVTWTAININELEDGAFINVVNDHSNINAIQDLTTTLNLASLNLPTGTRIDLSQSSIYLNGKLNDDLINTQELLVNNNPSMIRACPIPVVIPLIVEPSACDDLVHTIDQNNRMVTITNDLVPSSISYIDNNDPSAPPMINTVCEGDCEQTETVALPVGSFNFSVTVADGGNTCSRTLTVLINDPDPCNNITIIEDNGLVNISNNNNEQTHIQITDLANNNIIFDNENSSNSVETELDPGNYEILILECQGATINYGEGQIFVTMDDGQNAGIQIHDLDNNWMVVGSNNYSSNRLEVDLPGGNYLVKINSIGCDEIELADLIAPRPDDELLCQGATITYGEGQISVTMDDGQNAGIKIHDILNGWVIVGSNDYQSSNFEVDLPEGEYLVKINSNECDVIFLEAASSPEPTICSDANILFNQGKIDVLMNDNQLAVIEIINDAGQSMINNTVPRIQLIVDDLPEGSYTVSINDNICEVINVIESQSFVFGNDENDQDKSITVFPNPAQDHIRVHLPNLAGIAGTIQVLDAYGQIITEHTTESLNNYERLELNNARNGLYFMTIKAENKKRIGKRFVVEDGK